MKKRWNHVTLSPLLESPLLSPFSFFFLLPITFWWSCFSPFLTEASLLYNVKLELQASFQTLISSHIFFNLRTFSNESLNLDIFLCIQNWEKLSNKVASYWTDKIQIFLWFIIPRWILHVYNLKFWKELFTHMDSYPNDKFKF